MSHPAQVKIPATCIRGGTSEGIFFRLQDLPPAVQQLGAAYDALLMHVIGDPDPYGKQIDDVGGVTSSIGKTAIPSKSTRPDHDAGYLFDQVSIDKSFVDWSGNCGDLPTAAGLFAISNEPIDASRTPQDGATIIRIWQASVGKTIIAHVPITNSTMQKTGDLELGDVTFPAAGVQLELLDSAAERDDDGDSAVFPIGSLVDDLEVPGVDTLKATIANADTPTIFISTGATGYTGTELQDAINGGVKALTMFGTIHARSAMRMELVKSIEEAATRQHTPKVTLAVSSKDYMISGDKKVDVSNVDLSVHVLSIGKLHYAMMGTTTAAVDTATIILGTPANLAASGGERGTVCFGHPSDTLRASAETRFVDGEWTVTEIIMSRNACVLMEGWVRMSG